jgi:hypothetical protein
MILTVNWGLKIRDYSYWGPILSWVEQFVTNSLGTSGLKTCHTDGQPMPLLLHGWRSSEPKEPVEEIVQCVLEHHQIVLYVSANFPAWFHPDIRLVVFLTVLAGGRHLKRYSVIAIMLRYIFALSYNVVTLWRNIIGSISYRSGYIGDVIASYSYRSKLIDQRYRFC